MQNGRLLRSYYTGVNAAC